MSESARSRLALRRQADYDGFGYAPLLDDDLNAIATVGNQVASDMTATALSATIAQNSLALAQALIGLTQGVGVDPLDVVRNIDLGSAAFASASQLSGVFVRTRGAAYQIVPQDNRLVLLATSGTLTWTLPLLADLFPGWFIWVKNRTGANLTINRSGTDVIDAAGTSIVLATGLSAVIAYRDTAGFERVI